MRNVGVLAVLAAAAALLPTLVAAQDGRFALRARIVSVRPDASSSVIEGSGATMDVGSATAAEVGAVYMFHWAWGVELGYLRSGHDFDSAGGTLGDFRAGSFKLATTIVTLQYHFPTLGVLRPYLGLGLNHAGFSSCDVSEQLRTLGVSGISIEDSFGPAFQAGLDVAVTDRIAVNVDARFARVSSDTEISLSSGGVLDVLKLDLDPWLIGIGVSYSF